MAEVADCIGSMDIEVEQQNNDQTVNISPIHLLKIDFPLVSQEYQEHCTHYIGTISEKVVDPDGYFTMKTKVDHYLYTVNVSSDIGKPLLSDIVRFPQEILTPFTINKTDKSQDCSLTDLDLNNNFANLEIKSNHNLINENQRKKKQNVTSGNRKKLKRDDDDCDICNCDDDESVSTIDGDECICDDYDDFEEDSDYDCEDE